MSDMSKVLSELDVNIVSNNIDVNSERRALPDKSIVCLLDKLRVGRTQNFGAWEGNQQLLHLEICWWDLRRCINEKVRSTLSSITRKRGNTAMVVCRPQFLLHTTQLKDLWVKIKLARRAQSNEMRMVSENVLSMDGQWATVFLKSAETLLQDVHNHKELMLHKLYENLPQESCPVDASFVERRSTSVLSVNCSRPSIETYDLSLTKSDVSYLIGKQGGRIKSIREASETTIKILPISKKLTPSELNHPDAIVQTVTITGDLHAVAVAIATIEAHLRLHHVSSGNLM